MGTPFKMNGAGEVYYEGSGDPVNLNPNDLTEGDFDDFGNKEWIHKETQDIFYKNKPREENTKWQGGPKTPSDRPIEEERFYT